VQNSTHQLSNLQFALLLSLPVLLFLLLVMGYPMVYAIWLSLHDVQFLFGKMRAEYVGGANFAQVVASGEFWRSIWVSIRFTVESVILTLTAGLALALVMNMKMRYRGLIRTLIILPWAVSLYGTGVMWFYLARGQSGLATSISYGLGFDRAVSFITSRFVIEVLALANAWNMAPLVAFFLLANLNTIPERLYHLAAIDRLNPVEKFVHVTLPPLRFTLFVFTAIATVLTLKQFDLIYILSRGGPGDVSTATPILLYDVSFKQLLLGYGSAMSFLLLVLIVGSTLLLYLLWGRREEMR
jgi:multiple sugar transport system permease protein